MNRRDGLHFIIEVSVMDASFDQMLTKENGHDIWNDSHTYRNGRVGIRRICQKLGRKGLVQAYLIGNDSVSIDDIHGSKIRGVSVDERWLAVRIIRIANNRGRVIVTGKGLRNNAASLGEEADNSRS